MQENPETEKLPELIHVTFTPLELATLHNFFALGYFHMLHEVSPECIEEYHLIFNGVRKIGPQLELQEMHDLIKRIERLCLAVSGVKDVMGKV